MWEDDDWRVIGIDDVDFPLFYRVISRSHVEEFSLLARAQRAWCMELVCAIESVLLEYERPTSINLATFGNVVPHLHWHVIARFDWDSHFPEPVWAARQRNVAPPARDRLIHAGLELDDIVRSALNDLSGSP